MTTLDARTGTALLVVDVQAGVVADAHARDTVVANISSLVARARDAGIVVVWIQHSDDELEQGSAPWQLVPELTPLDAEPLVRKTYGDSFESTNLEDILAAAAVGRLVVTGASTDACIRSTIHGAFVRGYDVTLVADAHTTADLRAWGAPAPDLVIAHTNLYWQHQSAPGRTASVIPTEEVAFAPA